MLYSARLPVSVCDALMKTGRAGRGALRTAGAREQEVPLESAERMCALDAALQARDAVSEAAPDVAGQARGTTREHRAPSWPGERAKPRPTVKPSGRLGSWHLPLGETLSSFCQKLNERNIIYAVLPAPAIDGPATGLLVADEDVLRLRDLVTRVPLGQQLAIYSITGLPGFSFQQHWRFNTDATNMAVLPPHVAESLLARAVTDEFQRRVPLPEDRLSWLIYRTLYLSGDTNVARPSLQQNSPVLGGLVSKTIGKLAREAGVDLVEPFELEALDSYLASRGWHPPYEVLRRLSCWNSWAASKLQGTDTSRSIEEPGVAAFFVRREALVSAMEGQIATTVESCGFELLKTIDLDDDQIEAATRLARGANWGPGALPVNGGPPVRMIIAFDVLPARVTDGERERYPFLDNQRTLHAKLRCRELIKRRMPRQRWFNPLHATDDSGEAWKFIQMFAPQEEAGLRSLIESRRREFATDYEVVRNLSRRANRAKVELVHFGDGLAVKKTFRHNCLKYMQRELSVLDTISPHRPEILPVLERGPNYFVTPFVDGRPLRRRLFGRSFPRLMSVQQVRDAADLLRCLFSHGFDPVDLAAHNLLVANSGKLTAVDFELAVCGDEPVNPELSACLRGAQERFDAERPVTARWIMLDPYGERWFPYTGLTLHSFLHDPPSIQALKRLVNYPAYLGRKAIQRQYHWLGTRAKAGLKRWLPVLSRIASNAYRSGGRWH